jgi:hypothetical protein
MDAFRQTLFAARESRERVCVWTRVSVRARTVCFAPMLSGRQARAHARDCGPDTGVWQSTSRRLFMKI